jgi:two-component system chemotaxis sensor kinase CheA
MPANDEAFLKRLRAAFQIEAEEHVQAMAAGLLELEGGVAPERRKTLVETIYREAHSLKGAARAVNMAEIETVCQAIESVFSAWKRGELEPEREQFDALHRGVNLVTELLSPGGGPAPQISAAVQALAQVRQGGGSAQRASERHEAPAPSLPPKPGPPLDSPPSPPPAPRDSSAKAPPKNPIPAPAAPREPVRSAAPAETVRISTAKLDSVLLQAEEMLAVKMGTKERTGELRALSAELTRWQAEWARAEPELRALRGDAGGESVPAHAAFLDWNLAFFKSLDVRVGGLVRRAEQEERTLGALVDELLADAKRLVMLPFSRLMEGFPRLVRELSREEGKDVQLLLSGHGVEIDKRILEEMKDALVHLLRNCVDHGVELPAERIAAGKPARATIELHVFQAGASEVNVCVSDDGRGIEVEKVKAVAVRKGLLTEEEAARMPDEQARGLIFQSDLSTSPTITQISGRGLGMAIVRERVQKLGGRVVVESDVGRGATFRITLPLTLATLRGLTVHAAGQAFVVPLNQIERVVRVRPADVETVESRDTITMGGRVLPLVRLAEVLELASPPGVGGVQPERISEALILGVAEERIAFRVDAVGSEAEVLVKPLGWPLLRVRNIAGATVLANGRPVPILRVSDLMKSAVKVRATADAPLDEEAAAQRKPAVLVAEDSITSRTLLKNILESAGYPVTTAVDGAEALAALRAGEFGLVVSDIDMPRLDGFGLTAAIRADERLARLPVVLVSARETREDRERGVDVGASAYLVKSSFDQSDLLSVVARLA